MKKIFKLCSAVLISAVVFCLAGCSARTPVTPDEFKKQAEASGFKVTESESSAGNVEKYASAVKPETETEIVFISFKDDTSAHDTYNSIKTGLTNGEDKNTKNVDSSSYNKFTFQNGELSHTLVRMNKTIVYGKSTLSHTNEVEEVFKKIKY